MQIVGLNFSDASLEAVVANKWLFGKPTIQAISRVSLPEDVIENGIVLQPDELAKKIQAAFAQAEPKAIDTKTVTLSIPESQVYSRVLSFPNTISSAQIHESLQYQVSRYIPFEAEDMAYDYITLGVHEDQMEVLLTAVARSTVQQYITVCESIGLSVKVIELESLSTARAILPEKISNGIIGVVDIGARTTIVSFFVTSGLRFSFNIPVAGNHITKAVAEHLGIEANEAERRKRDSGLTEASEDKRDVRSAIVEAMKPLLNSVKEGIAHVEKHTGLSVKELHLTGGSAQLPELCKHVHSELSVDCKIAELLPFKGKNGIVDKVKEQELIYSNAVGLALGVLSNLPHDKFINFSNIYTQR